MLLPLNVLLFSQIDLCCGQLTDVLQVWYCFPSSSFIKLAITLVLPPAAARLQPLYHDNYHHHHDHRVVVIIVSTTITVTTLIPPS